MKGRGSYLYICGQNKGVDSWIHKVTTEAYISLHPQPGSGEGGKHIFFGLVTGGQLYLLTICVGGCHRPLSFNLAIMRYFVLVFTLKLNLKCVLLT